MNKAGNEPDSEMTGVTEFQGTSETQGKTKSGEMSDPETQKHAETETEVIRTQGVKKKHLLD